MCIRDRGVEAQTMANVYLALDEDLEILPCLNKIDLASARVDEVKEEIEDMIGIDTEDAPLVSADVYKRQVFMLVGNQL